MQASIRTPLAALLLSASALTASAGAPSALNHVPANTDVVIGIENLGEFLGDIEQFNRALGVNGKDEIVFVTAMARGMPGVNLGGSAAIVVDFGDDPEAGKEPTGIVLVPVSDFAAFSQQREAEDGVVQMAFPNAEVYARDVGHGYALLGDKPDALRAFVMTDNSMKAHTERLGGAGTRLVGDAEVAIIFNADTMRPYLDMAQQGMNEQGQMVAMMGGEQAAQGFAMFSQAADAILSDLTTGAFGVSMDEGGMSYDMALQFRKGSASASKFSKGGSANGLANKLPAGPYLFAASLDTSSPTVAAFADVFATIKESMPEEMRNQMGIGFGQMTLKDLTELTNGVSFVLGATPGLMGGGLFANTTQFIHTDNPGAYRQAMVTLMQEANGKSNQGVTLETSVNPDAVTIEGTSLTSYGVKFDVDADAIAGGMGAGMGMDPNMMMQMMFGPAGGPSGYMGEVKGGVVQTLTQGSELTTRAIKAAGAENGLGKNERFARVASALDPQRSAEIFVGVDEILNTVGPMLMMFGVIPQFEPVDALDPVALALSFDNGGFVGRIHMPMTTLESLIKLVPENPGGMGGGDGGFDF